MLGPMTGDRTIDGNWHKNINGLGKLGDWLGIKNIIQYLFNEEKTEAKIFIKNKQDTFKGLVTLFTTGHLIPGIVTSADVAGKRSIIYKNKNVIYLGGMPKNCMDSSFWDYLIDFEIRPFSNKTILKMFDGIYKYERKNTNSHYYFIANMSDHNGTIEIGKVGLLDENNQIVKSGQRKISAFSYEILRDRKKKV